jgi:hypothetical protein
LTPGNQQGQCVADFGQSRRDQNILVDLLFDTRNLRFDLLERVQDAHDPPVDLGDGVLSGRLARSENLDDLKV